MLFAFIVLGGKTEGVVNLAIMFHPISAVELDSLFNGFHLTPKTLHKN